MNNKNAKHASLTILPVLLLGISACEDVSYEYDIPQSQAQCPGGTTFRSGGSAIIDRSGGSSIRDRHANPVTSYCEEAECPGGNWSTVSPEMDWHLTKGKYVVANRTCLAP